MDRPVIYRAQILVPVSIPPIENGAVLVENGTVSLVATYPEVKAQAPAGTRVVDIDEGVIIPALVNCHSHLSLSWMEGKIPPGLGFASWLKRLMELIHFEGASMTKSMAKSHVKRGIELSKRAGVALVGDVTNSPYFLDTDINLNNDTPLIHLFWEIIHPLATPLDISQLMSVHKGDLPSKWSFSPHSLYTCSRQALWAIKDFCKRHSLPFSIHLAESPEEIEFVKSGTGPIAEILRQRQRDIEEFFTPSDSPVECLREEGLLDSKTICVHCTLLDDNDMDIIRCSGAWVCLCPESNLYISGLMPRADRIFHDIERVCFGTDSLASSTNLSILSQLRVVSEAFPSIEPAILFKAATLGGATALGCEKLVGSISRGVAARMLAIRDAGCGVGEVFEFLCSQAVEERIEAIGLQQ